MKSDWPVNPPRLSDVNHPKGVKMMKNEMKCKNLPPKQLLLCRLGERGASGEQPWGNVAFLGLGRAEKGRNFSPTLSRLPVDLRLGHVCGQKGKGVRRRKAGSPVRKLPGARRAGP